MEQESCLGTDAFWKKVPMSSCTAEKRTLSATTGNQNHSWKVGGKWFGA
jgi:hypothetical protein